MNIIAKKYYQYNKKLLKYVYKEASKIIIKLTFYLSKPTTILNNSGDVVYIYLTLKRQTKIAADDILIFYFYLSKKIRLEFSSSA